MLLEELAESDYGAIGNIYRVVRSVGSKVAQKDIIPTDEQVAALEKFKLEKQAMG